MTRKPLAYEAYEELADHYAAVVDTKPHNAYYERPAMTAMWPDLKGLRVLDAGCGPGVYTQLLCERKAIVTACDVNHRMLELARERVGPTVDIRQIDLTKPLVEFDDDQFDFVNAPLCLDYVEDWRTLFGEFARILASGGMFQFSCGHPAFDAAYFSTKKYFSVEQVECVWKGFGINVTMPSFRRSMQEVIMPLVENGFRIRHFLEPRPTEAFRRADPHRYRTLMHRPGFLCVQAELQ